MNNITLDANLKTINKKSFTIMTFEEYFDMWSKNKLFREIYPLEDTI